MNFIFVSYILEKEARMYPGSVRCNGSSNLPAQNFPSATPYADYIGYHHPQSMENRGQPSGTWGAPYGLPREDWSAYGPGTSNTITSTQINRSSPGQVSFSSADYSSLNPAGSLTLPSLDTMNSEANSPPLSQRHSSYEWMRKTVQSTSTGKTRTREKYRVVYTDHQRLELEKEFHYNRYITIRRKSELAANLRLSERQVKIWFQNRRAKERKLMKKKMTRISTPRIPQPAFADQVQAPARVGDPIPFQISGCPVSSSISLKVAKGGDPCRRGFQRLVPT
uniref:Homeobox domain-containing protein n=1 Tax=Laticauda laticaudata TaxID=8630 RepID=A0A8C5SME9_LATLA